MYPLLVFQLTVAHPRRRRFWKSVRKPGIMIPADEFHAGRAQHQFEAFCRKWSNAYCIARMIYRIDALMPNCPQGSLKRRQISVYVCHYGDLHVPSRSVYSQATGNSQSRILPLRPRSVSRSLEITDVRYFSTTKCTWFVASLNWGNSDVSAANSRTFSYASGSSFLSDSNSGAMPPRNPCAPA